MGRRFDAGPLSLRASIALAVAVIAAVATYLIGTHQQRALRLPRMASATVTTTDTWHQAPPNIPMLPAGKSIAIDRKHAQAIADVLNDLPRFPNGKYDCPADLGLYYHVHFVALSGAHLDAVVTLGGCNPVDVMEGSSDWNWDRWDRDGRAAAAIAAVLPR